MRLLIALFLIVATPVAAQENTTYADKLRWVEDGPQTLVSESCAAFRLHGVVASFESRAYEFFKVAYTGCSWLSQQPGLTDLANNPYLDMLASDINRLGPIFMDMAKDDYWLSDNGGFLIANEINALGSIRAAYQEKTKN